MEINAFKEALMLYGADINVWPEELAKEAAALLKDGDGQGKAISELIEAEAGFEALLANRTFEEPGEYLAQRIITHAEDSVPSRSSGLWAGLFVDILTPKASFALVLVLVIGFMVGYMDRPSSYDSLYSDEMIEESFMDLLMEDDIFVE